MQVKSLLKRRADHSFDTMLDHVVMSIQKSGSATLQTWVDSPITGRQSNSIYLGSMVTRVPFGGAWTRTDAASRADVLFILGGRGSIVHWLKVQGESPTIYNPHLDQPLHMTALRKKALFDKNLTLIAIHPLEQVTVHGTGWDPMFAVNMTQYSMTKLAEFSPKAIGQIAEQHFASY